ncbi:MAG: hypothetical protein AAFZ09_17650, partial [Pseudomonadota bacterium]
QVAQSQAALQTALERIDELENKAVETDEAIAAIPEPRVRPGRDNVDLQVYGHINQAFRFASNSNESRFDIVDNDNSGSRLGFRGRYRDGKLSAGVRAEVGFEVNTTDEIGFDTEAVIGSDAGDEDFLTLRHADTFLGHADYGTISIGFGPTATEGVSETDLSGTTLIAESDVDDIGGELEFGNDEVAILGDGFEVDDFFSNLDGSRTSRIGYASPRFNGIQGLVSARLDDDDAGTARIFPDVSVNYEGAFDFAEVEAQAGYRRETESNVFIASTSGITGGGTSLTLGGGLEFFDGDNGDPTENFVYAKLGQKLKLFEIGGTAMSIDFFRGEDNSQMSTLSDDQTEAISIGGGVVQQIKPLGAEV